MNKDGYIYINSINEIDPKKLTIRDLNKKFIDRDGRRYAVKYDFEKRKIEFIRIATSYYEALQIREEILKEKKSELANENHTDSYKLELTNEFSVTETDGLLYDIFLDKDLETSRHSSGTGNHDNEFYKLLEKETRNIMESFQYIEKVLSRSQSITRVNIPVSEYNRLIKEIEAKCYTLYEEAMNTYREVLFYPRTLNFYLTRLPSSLRYHVESLPQEQQLDFIRKHEIHRNFRELFENILKYTKKFEDIFYRIPIFEREKKPLMELSPSFSEITEKSQNILQKLKEWSGFDRKV